MGNGKEIEQGYPKTAEFPIPYDRVALFDLDETLIDNRYNITDDAIYDVVSKVQDCGWQLGLSSDSSLETLRQFRDHFSFNGPIIAERGAVVEFNGEVVANDEDVAAFHAAKEAMEQHLHALGVVTWSGDPAPALRDGLQIGGAGDIVTLVNQYRRSSIGLFFRSVNDDGQLVVTPSVTDTIVGELRNVYPDFSGLHEDLNHEYGVLILSRQEMVKRIGTQILMQRGGYAQIAMVGNAMTDYVGSDIALHFAVGNAKDEFKQRADFVSGAPLTGGAVDILERFIG